MGLLAGIAWFAPAATASRSSLPNTAITLDGSDYPEYKIFQRDSVGNHALSLRGTITGPCSAVEASFAGRAYTVIDSDPGARFAGSLTSSTGQGAITVRCTNNRGLTASVANIGIGDVYVVAGQSNAEGHGIHAQSYTTIAGNSAVRPTVFTEADQWKLDNDLTDIHSDVGSVWPIVGGYVVANESVPVAFITTALGGTKLVSPTQWQPGGAVCATLGVNCYDNMVRQVADAGVNGVKAVLWFQGEGDARAGTTWDAYNRALDGLAANVRADLPGGPPVVAGVIGPWRFGGRATDAVRFATMEAWEDNPNVLAGPQSYDIQITGDGFFDDLHFATDDEFQTLGYRWWRALDAHFYSRGDGRGPVAQTAVVGSSGGTIDVSFSDASGLSQANPDLSPSAWAITDGAAVRNVSSATVISSSTVRLVPATPLSSSDTIAVWFATTHRGEGAITPVDTATGNLGLGPSGLPADPFRNLIATRAPAATATATPRPTATAVPTARPRPTATAVPTARPRPTATAAPRPRPTATATATATPRPRPTATATPRPTAVPTARPRPTAAPAPAAQQDEPAVCAGREVTVDLALGQHPTDGADVIRGTAGPDVIDALGGDDVVCGLGARDLISGGDGNDLIYAGGGHDVVRGGAGTDRLYGQNGADQLHGGRDADRLFGGKGYDRLYGDHGDDFIQGSGGNDQMYGGVGDDNLYGKTGDDIMWGGVGDDEIYAAGGDDEASGGDGADRIQGAAGADILDGGAGADALYGQAGNDTLRGGAGGDELFAASGNDVVEGGDGDDELQGAAGDDTLRGGGGADRLYGQAGDDYLDGGTGLNRCWPGSGRNQIDNC